MVTNRVPDMAIAASASVFLLLASAAEISDSYSREAGPVTIPPFASPAPMM